MSTTLCSPKLLDVRIRDVAFGRSTGALSVRAYLRFVVFVVGAPQAPAAPPDHAQKLLSPSTRRGPETGFTPTQDVTVLQDFISALLPHLSSEETVPLTGIRVV